MPRRIKARQLTIFRIKEEFPEPAQILKNIDFLEAYPIRVAGSDHGQLYIQPTHTRAPSWLSFFDQVAEIRPELARNASTAAVWILTVEAGTFALTFGYGRNLLRLGVYVEDFGLRVTLNAVNPEKIKAVDRMTIDAVAQQGRIQATREANIGEFGLDVEQDLLRAVTGVPTDETLGLRLTGRDALQTFIRTSVSRIPALVARLSAEFAKVDYKANFSWIDLINEIDDPMKRQELDNQMVERLRENNLENIWLAIPEMIDWEGLAGFKYSGARHLDPMPDVHLQSFLDHFGDLADLDDYALKRQRRIYAISSENDTSFRDWPVYRCLYCESRQGDDTYLLNNARWYRIASDFVARVTEAVQRIPDCETDFPEYRDSSEAAYSTRVAAASNGSIDLMDRRYVRSAGLPSPIEFCDLYSCNRQIIHLKRYTNSSTLSHLFAQGVVSAKVFLNEVDFRLGLNDLLSERNQIQNADGKPNASDYEIVFGIISQSRNPLVLPFFSRVNLKNACSNLQGMGFRVSIKKILAAGPVAIGEGIQQ